MGKETGSKKIALLRILQILQRETDETHPLTQEQIGEILRAKYGIVLERKAIADNLRLLEEAGYGVVSERRRGSYFEHEFDDTELRVLIDAVMNSRYITKRYAEDLVKKLKGLSNEHFHTAAGHIVSLGEKRRTDNREVFRNLELIDEAIESKRQVTFSYRQLGFGLKLKSRFRRVSPYRLILFQGQYYLLGKEHRECGFQPGVRAFQLDHITKVAILEQNAAPIELEDEERLNGIEMLSTFYPAAPLRKEKPERIELLLRGTDAVEAFVEQFGDCTLTKLDDPNRYMVKVEVEANPDAVEQWVLLHLFYARILAPSSLKEYFNYKLQSGLIPFPEE